MPTKNKFAHPPYLPEFKKEDALRLRKILHIISRTCCRFKIPEGVIDDIDDILERPSRIRECDLHTLKPVVDAINMVAEGFTMRGLTKKQLEYLFREYSREVRDEHLYDAARALAWYTGYYELFGGDIRFKEIDRSDGAYAFWRDKPYAKITEEEYRELIGVPKEEDE